MRLKTSPSKSQTVMEKDIELPKKEFCKTCRREEPKNSICLQAFYEGMIFLAKDHLTNDDAAKEKNKFFKRAKQLVLDTFLRAIPKKMKEAPTNIAYKDQAAAVKGAYNTAIDHMIINIENI